MNIDTISHDMTQNTKMIQGGTTNHHYKSKKAIKCKLGEQEIGDTAYCTQLHPKWYKPLDGRMGFVHNSQKITLTTPNYEA